MCARTSPRVQRGLTLMELTVSLVIVAVLAGIALPGYRNAVSKSHRSAAQAEMLDVANRQQQYLLANREYATTFTDLGYRVPASVMARYTCVLEASNPSNGLPAFTVSCVPTALQAAPGFGALVLDGAGTKTPAGEW